MKFLSDILAKAGLTVDGVVTLNNTATGQTPNANDNSTKLATTAWVRTFVQPYSLPIATSSVLGGIKVGTGLSIDAGTGVLSVSGGGSASIKSTQTFTATAAQTVFTISGGYSVGLIDVFLNGVYLSPNQTTATNGTTITLGDASAAGDIIDVIIASPVYQGATTTTDQLSEGSTNLYFTDARARAAISESVTGLDYNSATGVFSITTGYGIPTTASQTTWDAAYNDKINSAAVTGTTTKTLTLTQQDGGTITASWTDDNTDAVTSVFGRTGAVVATSGDYTTALVTEVTNLYYTDARARAAISVTGSGSYDSATGIITVTGGVTSVNTLTGAVTLTTTNIGEGTNLYYTTARANSDFDTRLATKSTTNLAEGTNLYYTTARANSDFDTRLATKSTTNLAEGTNLYYTDTRVGTYLTANSYATQSYVSTQINNLVSGAPGLLDTLDELAAALGDDPNFATTVSTALGNRLRIDIGTQGLTGTQQGYGRTNLGLGSLSTLSSIGDAYITDLAYSKLTGVPSTFAPSAHTHDDRYYTETEIGNFFSGASAITGYNKTNWDTAYGWGNHASGGYLTGITSSQVTTALGYTPYNSTNPNGYITSSGSISGTAAYATQWGTSAGYANFSSTAISTSVGWLFGTTGNGTYAPVSLASVATLLGLGSLAYSSATIPTNNNQLTNGAGYITGITSSNVTTALGFTPYNASNPSGYVTSSNWAVLTGATNYNTDRTTKVSNGLAIYSAYYGGSNAPTTYDISAQYVLGGKGMEMAASWHSPSATMYFRTLRDCCDNWSPWTIMLSALNYNDYSPTKTGGGASGSWSISVTGSAGSVAWTNVTSRPTALSQFTNDLGNYGGWITSYTESDTLATVTGRGASTSTALTLNGTVTFTSSYSGDSADYTGISNPSYKVSPTSGYWRVVYLSNHSTVSGVYNFQTGKNVYWGEPDDTGGYYFRGRTLYTNGNAVIHAGNISSQSVSYANSAGAVAWSNVSAGYRENYDLGFRPPNSSSSYAGFRFGTVGNDGDAGYLLVRGGADSDVYTQGGITLVADAGWLTLAQRTSSSKGVRIMTGSSTSVTRLEIATTGMTTINAGLVVTSGLAWNDGTPALSIGGSGDARLQVRHIWGKDAGTSGKDHLWLNYSTGGNHVQIGSSGEGNNLYVAGTVYVGGYFTGNAVVHAGNIGSQSVSYASSAGSSHGMPYDGNAISGMGPISNWDTRPGVGQAGFGINWHTGVTISGYAGYGGVRLYASGYPTHSGSVLRLEASGAVYTYGGLYSDSNLVLHAGNYTSYALSTSGGAVNGSISVTSNDNSASCFTNSDLGNAFYTNRGNRLLTSNGTNWAGDGRDPALVVSGSYSDTNRGRIGLAFHNETNANNAFAPMIAFSTRSNSGNYNTVYASIMGRHTGYNTGVDTNWASGELHFYAHGSAYVDDTPTMKLTGAGFLQVASGGGSSTATFSLLQTGYSNAYFQYNTGKLQIGGDSGLSDGIYFNMYNGSGYGDRFVIKPNGRVNIISGGRTLSLGDGNYSNHILVDSNVDFAFNYNNGSTGGFGFFGGTSSAKFMCSYTGTLTVSGDVVAYGSPSDARLKDIKEKVPNALNSILKLNGYRFDWKEKELDIYGDDKKILHIKEDIGVIAQEVADVLPELAKTNEDGFMSVRYQGLTAVLIEAVKEQQTQIESQKSEIEELKDLVKQLINR